MLAVRKMQSDCLAFRQTSQRFVQIFDSNFDLRIFNEFSLMDNTVCFNFHGNGKRHTREGMGLDLFDSNGH